MNQTLHIFKKDARRFWIEILLSLAVTTAFVVIGAFSWPGMQDARGQMLRALAALLAMLVPVSWWILIARGILAERLVGDTQFWIARPYAWTSLLAAKLLFIVASLYLPFFIAQCLLLMQAGFPPLLHIPGILFNMLLLTGTIVLPLAAIATVTSSFARTTLTLLGIFLGFIILVTVAGIGFATDVPGVTSDIGLHICLVLAILAFSIAILLQYSLRRVWTARLVLLALPILLFAAVFFASRYDQANMFRLYPSSQGNATIQLTYSPDTKSWGTESIPMSSRALIPIDFRIAELGVIEGYAAIPDAVRGEITAPDGSHWSSEWQGSAGYKFLPGESFFSSGFSMPLAIYRKYAGVPLQVHLSFAITQARADKTATIPLSMQPFAVPDFGVCSPQTGWSPIPGQVSGIDCVAALREPQLTYIVTRWSDTRCSASREVPASGAPGTAWVGSLDREPAQIGFSSVKDVLVNLSNSQLAQAQGTGGALRYLCAGTPITFTEYTMVNRMQVSMDIKDFQLPKIGIEGNMITITQ
jgi:hypothetical protein